MNERDKELAKQTSLHRNNHTTEQRIAEIQMLINLVRADEREACAVLAEKTICDTHIPTGINIYGTRAAKSIRARSPS